MIKKFQSMGFDEWVDFSALRVQRKSGSLPGVLACKPAAKGERKSLGSKKGRLGEEEERAPSDKGRGEEEENNMKRRVRFLSEVLWFKG